MTSRRAAPGLTPAAVEGEPFGTGGRVAVVRLDGFGDVLLTGPAVRAVADRADEVTFIAGPRGAEAAALLPGVDRVEVLDAPWVPLGHTRFSGGAVNRAIDRWRAAPFDAAVVFTSWHQSPLPVALMLRLADTAAIAGISDDHPGALLDVRLRHVTGHEVRRNLAVAAAAGYRHVDGERLRIRTVHGAVDVTDGVVVVHPGASVPARALPRRPVRGMIRALVAEGRRVVATGTAAETATIAADLASPDDDLGGRTTVEELAAVMARAGVVVVGNTGPAHLAAALGRPIVSVFAPVVDVAGWHPWTDDLTVLGDQKIVCRGCRATVCPRRGQPCVDRVTAESLLAAVHVHLGGEARTTRLPA